MHPIIVHQIAALQIAERHRRADLHHAHAPVRRTAGSRATPTRIRSSVARARAVLATTFRTG